MKGIVRSCPDLLECDIEIEAWCWEHDDIPGVRFQVLPFLPTPNLLQGWAFFFVAHIFWILWILRGRKRAGDVLFSTGFYLLPADCAAIHFSTLDWIKAELRIGFNSVRDWLEIAFSVFVRIPAELLLLWNPWPTNLIAVSRSVGEDMKKWGAPWKSLKILPNPYDPIQFNDVIRIANRVDIRAHLHIPIDHHVLVFASTGHYQRKGFWLAVEGISILRKKYANVHLLVIGGHKSAIERLSTHASRLYGDWTTWLHFTGMTREMPKYLSAGDAFLFPSYCEAFALVEIEAAAMGLRLYLTPHHGSEMILRNGENGREIPWEAEGIARILAEDLAAGRLEPGFSTCGEAPSQFEYASRLIEAIGVSI
jgi:glycosyltransferase involved in cell wall biosynthesis